MIGICNGFQALIKTGLALYGEIRDLEETSPTLTFNKIGRHIANISYIRPSSNMSPWLNLTDMDKTYINPISHGEGRFMCSEEELSKLIENHQVAFQYTDIDGYVSSSPRVNCNSSVYAIEGITSPCGRVLGKMGHIERIDSGLYKNIPGNRDINIFKSGIEYFK